MQNVSVMWDKEWESTRSYKFARKREKGRRWDRERERERETSEIQGRRERRVSSSCNAIDPVAVHHRDTILVGSFSGRSRSKQQQHNEYHTISGRSRSSEQLYTPAIISDVSRSLPLCLRTYMYSPSHLHTNIFIKDILETVGGKWNHQFTFKLSNHNK